MKQVQKQGQSNGQVKCLNCTHIDFRASPCHTLSGWAVCTAQSTPDCKMFAVILREHDCAKFEAAPEEIVAGREKWMGKNCPGGHRGAPDGAATLTKS